MLATSASLLERLKEPGSPAWPRFVSLYTPLLYHWAKQFGLRPDDAADLVQDVLTVAVRRLPTFDYRPDQSFRGWLRTVTFNHYKRTRCAQTPIAGGELADVPDTLTSRTSLAEDQEYARILVARGMDLIRDEFSEKSWQAFEAHMLKARPAAEVAADLGVQVGTVYAAKSRILARLREVLAGHVELN